MTTFAARRDRIRARLVTIGRQGEEAKWVVPRDKPIIEFNGYVLWAKLGAGLAAATCVLFGWLAGQAGLGLVLILAGLAFLIGFWRGRG